MAILVIAEHDNASLKAATLNTVSAAAKLGGEVHVLVAGANCGGPAEAAAKIAGVAKVRVADAAHYESQTAENVAALVVANAAGYTHILAPRAPPTARTSPRASPRCSTSRRSPTSSQWGRPTPSCARSTPATRWLP
jgi:electron transfer flavoprotein alpha subunit